MVGPMDDSLRTRLAAALGSGLTLEQELDGGGMSRVFLARDVGLGRRVVVKVLPEDATGAVSLERFRREISVAAGITHPHVVPLLAAGDAGGVPYYTMPYVDGETLRGRLVRGRVPLDEAVGILRDIAKGLAAAHARGVVHRDVKPENVLLVQGSAMVTDFGVAKALSASTGGDARRGGLTAPGLAVGTPAYMAPEQIAGDPLMDHRVDIYAWGVVAYELLAGEHPFAGRAPGDLLAAQLTTTAAPLASKVPTVPRPLATLVERAMQKAPGARPSSATELVSMLGHLRLDAPTAAAAATSADGPRSRLQRRVPVATAADAEGPPPSVRVPWRGLLGALAVLGALGAGFAFLQRDVGGRDVDARVVAVAPFRVGGAPDVAFLREGMMDLLAPALTGVAGTRAVDVRSFLSALRREPGGDDADLDALQRTARSLGAAQLIDGSITGTRQRLSIRAVLYQTRDGAEITAASVEGSADSMPALVARLAATLLAARAGELETRVTQLLGRDPVAVRTYLDGLVAYREGAYDRATAAFDAAVDRDSTFAMAALLGSQAAGWSITTSERPRLELAWRRRDRLTADDSALVDVLAGAAFPAPTPAAERLASAERLVARRPDHAEAHMLLGELLFHTGQRTDTPDWMSRSIEQFERAVALDSTLRPAQEHLPSLYAMTGRIDAARAALRSLLRADTLEGILGPLLRMETAAAIGDSAEFRRAAAAAARRPPTMRAPFGAYIASEAVGHGDIVERLVWSAWDEAGPRDRNVLVGPVLLTALVQGQAWRLWDILRVVPDDTLRAAASLVAATLAAVEPMPVAEATRRLEAALPALLDAPTSPAGRNAFTAADGPWALLMAAGARGDTVALDRLRAALPTAGTSSLATPRRRALLTLLDLERASVRGTPAVALIAAADSASMRTPDIDGLGVRWSALRIARAWAAAGRLADARRVIARNVPVAGGLLVAVSWRDAARYAEAAGARDDARRAWQAVHLLQARAARSERAIYDEATRALARLADDAPTPAPGAARRAGP